MVPDFVPFSFSFLLCELLSGVFVVLGFIWVNCTRNSSSSLISHSYTGKIPLFKERGKNVERRRKNETQNLRAKSFFFSLYKLLKVFYMNTFLELAFFYSNSLNVSTEKKGAYSAVGVDQKRGIFTIDLLSYQ
ncbi:hypothetical protein Ahy_B08g089805 isoform K [Arachis hypogaea]|uniref:Uncharacterized protein n=1 Tax=Arachis hypogaea TaxID=3818 RepID=A0A444XYU5_ARAHY|nr:hypothetical protein Ahy_B08g089805 isoform K [Arachis hypogaea]